MRRDVARRAACLALVVLCAFSCACSTTVTDGADAAPTASVPQPSMEMVPVRGGDLFIAIPEDIESYDPLMTSNEDLVNFYTLMYETPFAYDETGRLVNNLIESWDVSADGRTFTFKIREDVSFSDGTPLTARDVYESARRALNAAEVSIDAQGDPDDDEGDPDASPTPRPTPSSGGSSTARRFANYGANITSMDQTGDYTMEISMRDPGNAALHFMTFPVTKADFSATDQPVGTGPYAIVSVDEDGRVTLEENPYWTGTQPHIERIVANPVSSPSEKIRMQQTSMLDFITTDALNAGNYNLAGKSKVVDYMTDYFDCLMPNLSDPELANINVRRAISEALDRRELLSTVLINHGVPTTLPVSPDSFVVDTRFRSNQRDVESALERLRAAGYRYEENGEGNILSFELIVCDSLDNSYWSEAARAIKKELADVFVEVEVVTLDSVEYLRRLENGSFDMAYCSFYLSEFPELGFLFEHDGSANYGGFYDQQVEDAIAACSQAITEEEMVSAYSSLQELLNAQLPIIGLYFRMHSVICDEGVGGLEGVREGTIFSDVESWYITSAPRSIEPNATPEPTPTPRAVTVPESLATPSPEPSVEAATLQPSGYEGLPPASDAPAPTFEQSAGDSAVWTREPEPTPEPQEDSAGGEDLGGEESREPASVPEVSALPLPTDSIIIPPDSIIIPPGN